MRGLPRLRPMLKAGLASGTIMSGGDLICQTIEKCGMVAEVGGSAPQKSSASRGSEDATTSGSTAGVISAVSERIGLADYDLVRTARFFGVGLTLHGPFFNKTLGVIEHIVGPATCARAAAKKVALGHVFLFPSYAFLFNVWMGCFEGKGVGAGVQKFRDTWGEVCVAGTAFWPAANMINFMYCPPGYRVLFLNGAGLYWNAFLSFQNVKANAAAAAAAEGAEGDVGDAVNAVRSIDVGGG